MADEAKVATAPVVPAPNIATLQTQLKQAINADKPDWKAIAKISDEIGKLQRAVDTAERDAKLKELETVTLEVKAVIEKALKVLTDAGKLDKADGVWYSHDFGDKLTTCKLMKPTKATKGTGGGGGTGKKFDITTTDLLAKHGGAQYSNSGMTCQQAHDADTNGNKRYLIRKAMLKLEGLA
jgi:hypothetical protein